MMEEERNYDQIIADCSDQLDASPDDVERAAALNKRGLAFTNKGEHDRGYRDFTEAILLGPSAKALRTLRYNRGRCLSLKGRYEEAIDDLDEAIRLNPSDVDAFVTRGLAWQNLGEFQKAISDYNLAISNDPESADAYHNRGNAWVYLGKLRKAIADFTRAIKCDPQSATSYNSRGSAWRRKGRYDKAIADFERALELEPHSADRRRVLAAYLAVCPQQRYRDGARALELLTGACELTDPTSAQHLLYLAAAHAEQGDFPSAIKILLHALPLASEEEEKEDIRYCIELYKAGEPWRMESPPWWQLWA